MHKVPTEDSKRKDDTGHIGRRSFLRQGAMGVAGAAALTGTSRADEDKKKTRLVMVSHPDATDGDGEGQAGIVKQIVDRSMKEFTGKDSLKEAWAALFAPDDIVGLKINVRGGRFLSTQPCVVDAMVEGLVAAGVKENNIIVWDAWTRELPIAGYTINTSSEGVRYYATDHKRYSPDKKLSKTEAQKILPQYYSSEATPVDDKAVYFSKILLDEITALINVPMIKDHRIAGVTCSMKNHYGSILNPNDLHGNLCDPYLGELNNQAPIKDKTRLILVDGLRALYHGGPRDNPGCRWRQNCIIVGTDTVAVDSLVLRIIEEKRKEEGKDSIRDKAHYIETAAKLGLGICDLSQVDLREITA